MNVALIMKILVKCSEAYCPSNENSQCIPTLKKYCTSDKLISDPRCKDWCGSNVDACRESIAEFCKGDTLDNPTCQTLCQQSNISTSNKDSVCLENIKEFCADKKISDKSYHNLCGCLYPPEEYNNIFKDLKDQGLDVSGLIGPQCLTLCKQSKFVPKAMDAPCIIQLMIVLIKLLIMVLLKAISNK